MAREVVGKEGRVVSVEIDPLTLEFARRNLARAGYDDVALVLGDGRLGHADGAPYDRIAVTAACDEMPAALVAQLVAGGRAIAPLRDSEGRQILTVVTKQADGTTRRESVCEVLYVDLRRPESEVE